MLDGRRVLIDGSMATTGGGYTYLVNMIPALAAIAPGAQFLVLVRNAKLVGTIAPAPNVEVRVLPERGWLGRIVFLAIRASGIARRWRADVYFSVAEYAPIGVSCPHVVCLRNPNTFTSIDFGWGLYQTSRLAILRRLAILSAKRASRVVFVSTDSASWMGDAAKIPSSRRAVIHHGSDVEKWRERIESEPRQRSPGILSVSSIYRYKNFVRLVEAYCEFAKNIPDPPPLTIVGDDQDAMHSADIRLALGKAGKLAEKIHLAGAVPYEEVISYYRDSILFVFPSYLETFGHPLLEAMASGLPVIAADIPVFREIAAESAIYVDPFDSGAIARSMERVLGDPELARRLSKAGRARVELFTWKKAADRLAALLDEVIQQG